MVQGQAIHSKKWVKKLFKDCFGRGGLGGNAPQMLEIFCYLNMKNVASHEFWNCFKSNIHSMVIYFLFIFLHNLFPWQIMRGRDFFCHKTKKNIYQFKIKGKEYSSLYFEYGRNILLWGNILPLWEVGKNILPQLVGKNILPHIS